ncbi:MAG: endonuclease V [Methanobacterium sp.]
MCSFNLMHELAEIQNKLSREIIKEDKFQIIKKVAGTDVSFEKNNTAIAAAVIIDFNTLKVLEEKTLKVELLFPYLPGFLGFREADGLISVLRTLENDFDILMVNGHGIMHPRGFGLASHVGLLMDVPTIGVAKRLIAGNYKFHDENSRKIVELNSKPVGACDRHNCVSVGHEISLKTSIQIVKEMSVFKMPEPIRHAHILATKVMKSDN